MKPRIDRLASPVRRVSLARSTRSIGYSGPRSVTCARERFRRHSCPSAGRRPGDLPRLNRAAATRRSPGISHFRSRLQALDSGSNVACNSAKHESCPRDALRHVIPPPPPVRRHSLGRAGPTHADLDARPRLPPVVVGEPVEVSALRIASRDAHVHGGARTEPDACDGLRVR